MAAAKTIKPITASWVSDNREERVHHKLTFTVEAIVENYCGDPKDAVNTFQDLLGEAIDESDNHNGHFQENANVLSFIITYITSEEV